MKIFKQKKIVLSFVDHPSAWSAEGRWKACVKSDREFAGARSLRNDVTGLLICYITRAMIEVTSYDNYT